MSSWRNRVREVANSTVADLGTVFLGAAAILLTRVIPEDSFTNFRELYTILPTKSESTFRG